MMSLSENSAAAANLLSAMANPKRLMILCCLVKGEVAVGALATKVGLSQSHCLSISPSYAPRSWSIRAAMRRQSTILQFG